jgi:hypothetical protein
LAAQTIPEADALILCGLKKEAILPNNWHSGDPRTFELGGGVICEPPRRGLVVEIYTTHGKKVEWRKTDFGLWDKAGGRREHVRVYQLTIAPSHLHTHTEGGEVWFGSHEHMGSRASKLPDLCSASFDDALAFFCQRTNIRLADPIEDPFRYYLR